MFDTDGVYKFGDEKKKKKKKKQRNDLKKGTMSAEMSSGYKLNKKLKLAIKRSRNTKDDVETLDRRKKGFVGNKKAHSRRDETVDTVPNWKRKRTFAERDVGEEGTFNINKRSSYKEGRDQLKDDFIKENRTVKGRSRDFEISKRKFFSKGGRNYSGSDSMEDKSGNKSPQSKWVSSRKGDFTLETKERKTVKRRSHDVELSERKKISKGGRNFSESESIEDRSGNKPHRSMWVSNGKGDATLETEKYASRKFRNAAGSSEVSDGKLKTKGKVVDRTEFVKVDGGGNDLKKKLARRKSDSSMHFDQNQSKSRRYDVSTEKAGKKTVQDKKSLGDDSAVMDDQPRKRKRIRLDPHDISNKRLDDGIVINEENKEKKEDLEKDVKLSQNAQFRAIQPSPSILSFVEDNLLGRRRLIELRRSGYNIELSAPLDNIPSSTSSERERIEESVFRNKLAFFAAAKVSSSFPPPDLPEIAFAGRSNVGKSSLLNALTRQWGVVRTSDKPGLTQTINFFKLGSKVCLVDLPGYGFAYAKEEVKDAWEELVKEYVSTRVGLKRVCLLIDTKWGMKPRDYELIDLMERSQTKYQIVLTKTDVVFPIDVARRAMQIEESLKANKSAVQPLMMVSSKSGAGIRSLRTVLAKIARFAKL
ncbi:hypothetical protein L1049_012865 [Liquidambar formosana]|uniref:EngB-type G domain-containing protein n=1 Tax=Liquidambar formosana TaxID=63359 RepID=A0AAP0WTR7_LIQFO